MTRFFYLWFQNLLKCFFKQWKFIEKIATSVWSGCDIFCPQAWTGIVTALLMYIGTWFLFQLTFIDLHKPEPMKALRGVLIQFQDEILTPCPYSLLILESKTKKQEEL